MNRYLRYLKEHHGYERPSTREYSAGHCPFCGQLGGIACNRCGPGTEGRALVRDHRVCLACNGRRMYACPACRHAIYARAMCSGCGGFRPIEMRSRGTFPRPGKAPFIIYESLCLECWRRREESGLTPAITARLPDGEIVHTSLEGVNGPVRGTWAFLGHGAQRVAGLMVFAPEEEPVSL